MDCFNKSYNDRFISSHEQRPFHCCVVQSWLTVSDGKVSMVTFTLFLQYIPLFISTYHKQSVSVFVDDVHL